MRRLGAVLFPSILLAACGEAPPPPAAPPPVKAAAPAPDLSPVPEPKNLLVLARWKDPVRGVEHLMELVKKPLSVKSLLEQRAPDVVQAVKFDASFDAVVALDPSGSDDKPNFFIAGSIPLTNFEAAKAAVEKRYGSVEETAPGVFRLPSKGNEKGRCDVAMAAGDAPARLVCGAGDKDLDQLRDYLTRGLAQTPPPTSDLTASLRFGPLRSRYDKLLRQSAPTGEGYARRYLEGLGVHDPELLGAPGVILDEGIKFTNDLDRLDLSVRINDRPVELVGRSDLRFRGQTSWLTGLITDGADRKLAAPPEFWRLPKDATSASWGKSGDPARFDGIRRVLHKAAAFGLEKAPMLKPADRQSVLTALDGIPRTSSVWVTAGGTLPRLSGDVSKEKPLAYAKDYLTHGLGWSLVGVQGPPAPYVTWGKELVDVWARGVRLFKENAKTKDAKDFAAMAPTLTEVRNPPGWPAGTVAFDLKITIDAKIADVLASAAIAIAKVPGSKPASAPAAARETATLRFAIVPEGETTWLAFSGDGAALLAHLKVALKGAPEAGTLAARQGIDGLKNQTHASAGFLSFGPIIKSITEAGRRENAKRTAYLEKLVAVMPSHGETPILFFSDGSGGATPSASIELHFEQGTIVDVVEGVVYAIAHDPDAAD